MHRIDQVFQNNARWVAAHTARSPDFFAQLARGQHPEFLYIGCCDSRVPANEIMGLEPGEVFVHRNIANLVVNTDLNVQGAIQFAVTVLEVPHVIVCGHYGCGGIQRAMEDRDAGLLNGWLQEIRDVYRMHRGELDAIEDPEARARRLADLNVYEQCRNVTKTCLVRDAWAQHRRPRVHGWIYDLADGRLRDLKFPFEDALREFAPSPQSG